MSKPQSFTYPFCYVPIPEIVDAAKVMIHRISTDAVLDSAFKEGKMLGVLMAEEKGSDKISYLFAFSGNVGGQSLIEGFVPPIFNLLDPDGWYRKREAEITEINHLIPTIDDSSRIAELKAKRKEMSVELQEWIFDQYVVSNALGESKTIRQVFADRGIVPPGGTGECAAPKLLQYAYTHGLKPLAMGEFWYGASPAREVRHQGSFYPSCTGKCGPLLEFMLQGLDVEPNPLDMDGAEEVGIIYEDEAIIVADKPSGMLSVPGRTAKTSLQEILSRLRGIPVYSCHRLDMDTSGLIVFAKNTEAQACLEQQFETRRVEKSYIAQLKAGETPFRGPDKGIIDLPLITDWYDRPRQMVDFEHGRRAVTEYEITRRNEDGSIEVRFIPRTGRTHQLRVHAAHPQGLGHPIIGDRLYGGLSNDTQVQENLNLRASTLSFDHPVSGKRMSFSLIDK